ncbi:circularly permuted type 2 ATP-grasp protein [Pseudohalioglobus sediminis]|uniref:Circularly permuted type 2 ATP-grasp protein n=1 Tax=Pseudohalioglobus sediminis TaxID=2606449 RepID=A0A5B0WPZ0_9GAMM|nr:circularly permuted type 2 ATP-grasp protein [Pseudohalioglobus sediminis]KAA1188856.1 circularly permuted type 2 ATP-grasp protein [Pseudohalioglobus sediminis]
MSQTQSQSIGQSAQNAVQARLEYSPPAGLLDESRLADGTVNPAWRYLLDSVDNLGPEALRKREQKARRILRDDGATYNIYGKPGSSSASWELDPLPYVIDSADWSNIEAGLIERSELFNLILRDLYGPRKLIRHGALPPEALFGHSGFLRACQGIKMPGEQELILHAADMVRRDDGSMCVLSDRTQAPSGAGYVLENRTVMSRVFPSLYRDSHVHRIASFYQRLRLKLSSLSPSGDIPRIALLTAGAQNESYFEHAYLANYMGFPMVQSGDLVVRNGFLWMKSLDGLRRVDVLLRRVDDELCDPVELRADSQLGVPGLLEVVRTGRVVLANPLGSGVLENAILLKYLPDISMQLLGREPRLASVKTYWAGDDRDLAYIIANIDKLIIKHAWRGSGQSSVYGGDLDPAQLQALQARIQGQRYQYVAQEKVGKSYTPTFNGNGLEPRPTLLRTFSVATDLSYTVLPGGLTRIGTSTDGQFISMQEGSPSKDTWITASEPERAPIQGPTPETLRFSSEPVLDSLPSRVVENLYWMGRYAERAEASMRLLRTVFVMLNGEDPISPEAQRILLHTVSEITHTLPGFTNATPEQLADPEEELMQIVRDGNRVGSVRSTINSMLSAADESKELLSTDTIRVINDLRDALDDLDADLAGGLAFAPEEALDPLVTALAGLSGLTQESMIRSVGWRFIEMGKRIERALQTVATVKGLLTEVSGEMEQVTLLTALLTSMEVLITYRRRGREKRDIELGLELVLLDSTNPRSVIFQLERLHEHLVELPKADKGSGELNEESRTLLEASTLVKLTRLPQLLEARDGQRQLLARQMTQLAELLREFSRLINDKHFDHRIGQHQLVSSFGGAGSVLAGSASAAPISGATGSIAPVPEGGS